MVGTGGGRGGGGEGGLGSPGSWKPGLLFLRCSMTLATMSSVSWLAVRVPPSGGLTGSAIGAGVCLLSSCCLSSLVLTVSAKMASRLWSEGSSLVVLCPPRPWPALSRPEKLEDNVKDCSGDLRRRFITSWSVRKFVCFPVLRF